MLGGILIGAFLVFLGSRLKTPVAR